MSPQDNGKSTYEEIERELADCRDRSKREERAHFDALREMSRLEQRELAAHARA